MAGNDGLDKIGGGLSDALRRTLPDGFDVDVEAEAEQIQQEWSQSCKSLKKQAVNIGQTTIEMLGLIQEMKDSGLVSADELQERLKGVEEGVILFQQIQTEIVKLGDLLEAAGLDKGACHLDKAPKQGGDIAPKVPVAPATP
jgi:translation elongation factor EF-1beta